MAPSRPGFTLVELLVVLAIIGLLAAMVIPATGSMMRAQQLSQSEQIVRDQLAFARQAALAKSRPVEVRFCRFGDSSLPGESANIPGSGKFRALQLFEISDDGSARPLTKIQRIPASTIIDSGSTLSTLLAKPKVWTSADPQVSIPGAGTSYDCRWFRFLPDGSTDLPTDGSLSFVTVHANNFGDTLASPPANFATIQVDAYNGHVRSFRP